MSQTRWYFVAKIYLFQVIGKKMILHTTRTSNALKLSSIWLDTQIEEIGDL